MTGWAGLGWTTAEVKPVCLEMTSLPLCIRVQIFASMKLHMAPRDEFFGTQTTVI